MTIVWVALMSMTFMFGMASLVVDTGYGMDQVRVMQNGADAGALAAARLLANSGIHQGGTTVFQVRDSDVHKAASDLASANRTAGLGSSQYVIAVRYLDCAKQSSGTPNFTADSNPVLVAEIGGTSLGLDLKNNAGIGGSIYPGWSWSTPICMVQVYARVTHDSLFAGAIGVPFQASTAHATARVFPTAPPKLITGVWPITHWTYPDPPCSDGTPPPCSGILSTFWDSNAPPGGNFKQVVNLSQWSDLALANNPKIYREQLFNCAAGGSTATCYDDLALGNQGKNVDIPPWIRNGWNGEIYISDRAVDIAACADRSRVVQECPNSRLELYEGTLGNNIGEMMMEYINAHGSIETIPPAPGILACNCMGATITVFFWLYGESNVAVTCTVAEAANGCVVNRGAVTNDVTGNITPSDANNLLKTGRIIVQKASLFHFNVNTVSNSSVKGYYNPFYTNNPPIDGTPSTVANTVVLVN